jgi:hypothetical protein
VNLLAACLYDPAVAVTKATSALLAMTALDTTNLRNTFTVPPGGRVRVRMVCTLHGATTFPAILLGVLNGATVVARVAPAQVFANLATAFATCVAEFVVTGLTPAASLTWDAAYGVETTVAATGIKYGGPNNTTANDAFGAFGFEVWDASPIYTPSAVPSTPVSARVDTIKTKTDSLTFTTALKVDAAMNAAADFPQAAADKVWSSAARTLTSFGTLAADVWAVATRTLTAVSDSAGVTTLLARLTALRAAALDLLDVAISSRSTYAGTDTPGTTTLLTRAPSLLPVASDFTPTRAAKLDNLDAAISGVATPGDVTVIAEELNPPVRRRVVEER